MGTTMGTTSHAPSVVDEGICSLVLDACDLVERYRHLSHADEQVAREAQLLRAELCAALGGCEDDVAADDGHGAPSRSSMRCWLGSPRSPRGRSR